MIMLFLVYRGLTTHFCYDCVILGLFRSDYTLCIMSMLFLVYRGLTTHFVL